MNQDATFIINIFIESAGMALCGIAIITVLIGIKAEKKIKNFLVCMCACLAMDLVSNIVGLVLKGNTQPLLFGIVRVANFCEFFFSYTLLFIFGQYLVYCIGKNNNEKIARLSINLIYLLQVVILVVSQFTDFYYYYDENCIYQRGEFFWVSHVMSLIPMVINSVILVINRKRLTSGERIAYSCYIIFPLIAMVLQLFEYGLFFALYSAILSVLILYVFLIVDQTKKYYEKEQENVRMQVDVMLSQIQPHFLYNSIGAICELCKKDPMQAREALQDFAAYLRGNMDSLNCSQLIPFSNELSHIETYLKLEKMRFGDKLNVIYYIEEKDFYLPSLTVQPIVENAVKHGICKKEDAGTLVLRTQSNENEIIITVIDDGVGFCESEFDNDDKKSHIGIINVKNRLKQMAGGRLVIESTPNKGTTARIILTKSNKL